MRLLTLLLAISAHANGVRVAWIYDQDVTFRIERAIAQKKCIAYSPIATVAGRSFDDRTVRNGSTYCYRIVALVDGIPSPPSTIVSVTVPKRQIR
jgi:hypothetical protein